MKNLKKFFLFFCMSLLGANCLAIATTPNPVGLELPANLQTLLATLFKKYPNNSALKILDDAELQKGKCNHPECCQKRLAVNRTAQTIYLENILEAVHKDPIFLERWSIFIKYIAICCGSFFPPIAYKVCKTINQRSGILHENASLCVLGVCIFMWFVMAINFAFFTLNIDIKYCRRCCVEKQSFSESNGGNPEYFYAEVGNGKCSLYNGYKIFYSENTPDKVEIQKYCISLWIIDVIQKPKAL